MYTRCVQGAYKMRTRRKTNSLPLLMCKREYDLSLLMCATCLSLNGYGRSINSEPSLKQRPSIGPWPVIVWTGSTESPATSKLCVKLYPGMSLNTDTPPRDKCFVRRCVLYKQQSHQSTLSRQSEINFTSQHAIMSFKISVILTWLQLVGTLHELTNHCETWLCPVPLVRRLALGGHVPGQRVCRCGC